MDHNEEWQIETKNNGERKTISFSKYFLNRQKDYRNKKRWSYTEMKEISFQREKFYISYDLSCLNEDGNSIDENIDDFIQIVQQDPHIYSKQITICKDLESLSKELLPNVEVKLLGSSLMNLEFKDSITDVFTYCPTGQPTRGFLAEMAAIISSSSYFKEVKTVEVKIPIITCTHVESGLSTEITFTSTLAEKNCQLIQFIVSLNPRIKKLLMVIKYWARCQKLSGVFRFSNYSLIIMTVFYLQQLEDPLVPPIKDLQASAKEKEFFGIWDCSICTDISVISPITNNTSMWHLLFEFFKFYSYFDFSDYVVCPFLGKRYKISSLKQYKSLPEEFNRYKYYCRTAKYKHPLELDSFMVVQDPFDLSHNMTRNIDIELFDRFRSCCTYVREEIFRNFNKKILMNIFHYMENIWMEPFDGTKGSYIKDIYLNYNVIPDYNMNRSTVCVDYKSIWFKAVQCAIVWVFEYIYLIKLLKDESISTESEEICLHRDCRTLQILGKGSIEIFRDREKMKNCMYLNKEEFYKEKQISLALQEEVKKREKEIEMVTETKTKLGRYYMAVQFLCRPNENPPKLTLEFTDTGEGYEQLLNFRSFISVMDSTLETHIDSALPHVMYNYSPMKNDPNFGNDIQNLIFDDDYFSRYTEQNKNKEVIKNTLITRKKRKSDRKRGNS